MSLVRALRIGEAARPGVTMRAIAVMTLLALTSTIAEAQVKASLVAADTTVQPGRPATVALRLDHDPHWHTFWINAGTGYPTSLNWELPAGWTAGPIQWPTPITIKSSQGDVTGHGYEGVLYLPVEVTVPDAARPGEATLRARAKWLMCTDVCIPGAGDVSLTLNVSADPPTPNSAVRAALAGMPMPRTESAWHIAAKRRDKTVALQITNAARMKAPHFFSQDAFIQHDLPQTFESDGGELRMTLPIADDAEAATDKLAGVLAYTDEKGTYRGVQVSAPLASGAAAAVAAGGAASDSGSSAARPGVGGASPASVQASLFVTLMLALVGGLILNLMPCVFPVLGIKVVGFINQAGNDRRKVTLHGLTFTAGVLLSFWALAAALATLRAGGAQLGWGFQLQSASFVFVLAVIMLVFALSLSGVFEFGLRATGVGSQLLMKEGYGGSFFAGVLATVVATPCSAPFLAPALGAALALPTAQSFLVFTFIAIGLSAPYLLLSAFPRAVDLLPKPGRWMETFKQLMAFPLYATVGYLIWVLAGQTSESGLLSVLFSLTVIALAVWLYGRYSGLGESTPRARFALAAALALLVSGVYLGWPRVAQAGEISWEPWSAERIVQLRAEGRPIYVDFTARWCATCQTNKKIVFGSEAVKKFVRDENVALLKADWTNNDPRITAELARWQRSAVPFNLVYRPNVAEPLALPELLTPSIVLASFRDP